MTLVSRVGNVPYEVTTLMETLGTRGVVRTSAVHRTVCPLNSVLFSFETAEFISVAVSNSTKLGIWLTIVIGETGKSTVLPFTAVSITTDFGVDNIGTRLTGKILEILAASQQCVLGFMQ